MPEAEIRRRRAQLVAYLGNARSDLALADALSWKADLERFLVYVETQAEALEAAEGSSE